MGGNFRPECPATMNRNGWQLSAGFSNKSVKAFKKAIIANPDNDSAYYNFGNYYFDKEDYPKAIEKFKESININKKNPEAHFNLACVYAIQKKSDKALQSLKEAIILGKGPREIIENDDDLSNIIDNPLFKVLLDEYFPLKKC